MFSREKLFEATATGSERKNRNARRRSPSPQSMEEDSSSSPRQRLKFLCSYGGKILPRPTDGQLKYLGGETRVVTVPRSVSSSELHDKIASTFGAPGLVIKYQLMPEDLDTLVSVRSDEDLVHMIDEYDRFTDLHRPSSPRFRLFLFSPKSTRSRSSSGAATPPENAVRPVLTLSPTNTSPTGTVDAGAGGGRGGMQRVRSTPNLGELQQSPAAVTSPSYLLRHPPLHKYTKAFGVGHHHQGGAWGGGSHMGGVRYDGYGYPNTVQHQPHVGRRYLYPNPSHVPPHVGPGFGHGGYMCYGHVEERGGGMRGGGSNSSSRPSYHFAAEMPPLQKPAFE